MYIYWTRALLSNIFPNSTLFWEKTSCVTSHSSFLLKDPKLQRENKRKIYAPCVTDEI